MAEHCASVRSALRFKGADPKPRKRLVLSKKQYAALVARLLGLFPACECGCGRRSETAHHVVPRGQGGDDVAENLLALAGHGTVLCHGAAEGNRPFDHVRGEQLTPERTRAAIRRRIDTVRFDVKDYVLERKGLDWLERRYPK